MKRITVFVFVLVLVVMLQICCGDENKDIEKVLGSSIDKWSISGVKYSTTVENEKAFNASFSASPDAK